MCVLVVTECEAVKTVDTKTCPADIKEPPEVEVVAIIIHTPTFTLKALFFLCVKRGGHSSVFVSCEVFRCSRSKYEA